MKKKRWTAKDIKNLRGTLDLSQAAFGERLGVTGNYIYLLESDNKKPGVTLRLLLDCIERDTKGAKS
jgi:DNA-binding transcriptional regulator YiaG